MFQIIRDLFDKLQKLNLNTIQIENFILQGYQNIFVCVRASKIEFSIDIRRATDNTK